MGDTVDQRTAAALKAIQAAIPRDSIITIFEGGVTQYDDGKLRALAQMPADDRGSVFLAHVIVQAIDLLTTGKLKGVAPAQVHVVVDEGGSRH